MVSVRGVPLADTMVAAEAGIAAAINNAVMVAPNILCMGIPDQLQTLNETLPESLEYVQAILP
jgi:hypothetical protein